METKEKRPEQGEATEQAPGIERRMKGPQNKLALVAFLGFGLMHFVLFFYALFVAKAFIPPIAIEAIPILLAAGIVVTRWRWAPHLGAFIALLTLYDPIFQPHDIYVFTHPGQSNYEFSLILLVIAFGLVALVACIGTIIRTHWGIGSEPRLPRFAGNVLSGFAGLVVGLILLSLIVTIVPQTSAASTDANGQPVVHMTANKFVQNVVLVPKGSTLLLVNDSSVEHDLLNGSWDASGTPHPQSESGAPTIKMNIINDSKVVGPFPTAGVYHLYCTLHPGMNLTLVVQ